MKDKMSLQPYKIVMMDPETLKIKWSDGETRRYRVSQLRDNCPCANCREQKKEPVQDATALPVISVAETKPLRITHMEPMGRYAYSIHFSDGHDTGLFTLELLRELGVEQK